MKKLFFISVFYLLSALSFAQKSPERDYTNAVLWQQYSGEYRALSFQAYNFARLSLKEALWNQANAKPNCVIVDADETILDNSAFQGHEMKNGVSYVQKDWTQWTSLAQADTVPGALAFLKFAASKNVETFYVTNREAADHDGTLKNLQKFGFPYADEAHLLLKTTTSDKEPRRQKILEKYNILLLCGDNLSDFSNVFYREGKDTKEQVNLLQNLFGTRFIVLPNPMYGDWEKLLYKGDKLNEADKAKQRFNQLKSY
ncbi:5'-nucleotidase, lipoprotein e(P4) family [Pedobacter boryungensis]|uniref:5'-nucleotidase, lipoprotein e(P4) family n=1 Tax=Pedobacter boryungensis TaxID=869962 RepID=A0ABX2DD83_9SPHI|nr:5'-nucleotidase, lipoprotein e(P4) family [Pedobacter boryungensis]NQX31992.1 5'-nucleotidase, lipoprotein e(P4) family [Pedobacter boryungensis]